MNKNFTLFLFFIFTCFFSIPQLSADTCVAISSGDWDDGSIWSCGHKPDAGDNVTIPSLIIVTVRYSDNLSGAPTMISIEAGGFLFFTPPCNNGSCKIDFELDFGSTIEVKGTNGITVNPLSKAQWVKVKIDGDLLLHNDSGNKAFPFGPGVLMGLGALPVELSTFKGVAMDRSNMLKWQTASEENTMVFLVERSLDGKRDFIEIGRVDAFGNSTALRSYEMEDGNPVSLAYYRLRIVDFDGTFEYSDVIAVERSKTQIDLVEVYPVPAEEEVTILVHAKAAGKAIITLSDFMGRKIKEEKVELNAGINRYTLEWEDHETVFYYLTIYNGNERIAKKILRASKD